MMDIYAAVKGDGKDNNTVRSDAPKGAFEHNRCSLLSLFHKDKEFKMPNCDTTIVQM